MFEAKSTLNIYPEIAESYNFVMSQNSVQPDTINQIDTPKIQKDTVPPQPTFEQIREWRWLREKKLLIDGSRYIQPKENAKLTSSVKVESENLRLPMREKSSTNTDWVTILFVLIVILFASVKVSYSKYIVHLFQSLISYSTSFRLFREKNYPVSHGVFRLDIIFYSTLSLLIYQVINISQLDVGYQNFTLYAIVLGLVLVYFILKKAAYTALGFVFESTSETSEYLFNMDSFSRILGIVLLPTVVLINYYPSANPLFMVVVGIITVAVFYAFTLQRGIFILLQKQFSIFYLFLYLCTLEFLPLFLIYNVVVL